MRYALRFTVTPRALEVLALAAQGLSRPEIGRRLWVTEDTVKTHLKRVSMAYGVSGSTQKAVIAAMAAGDLIWCPETKTIVVNPEALRTSRRLVAA